MKTWLLAVLLLIVVIGGGYVLVGIICLGLEWAVDAKAPTHRPSDWPQRR